MIDPSIGLDAIRDVAIVAGKIAAVDADIRGDAADTIDARGKIVAAPGLIDIHARVRRSRCGRCTGLPPGRRDRLGHGRRMGSSKDVVGWVRGDVVTHMGSTYQVLCDTARAPPHKDWACIATAGRDGRDGVEGRSVRVRGTYKAGENYAALDLVALNGGSFIARRDKATALAKAGRRNRRPARRARPASAVSAARWANARRISSAGTSIDRDNYTVAALLSDQTRSEPLNLRGLFEQYLLERINVERG